MVLSMDQAVEVPLTEGLPGGLDDVWANPDRCPGAQAVSGLNQHPHGGIGAVALIKDPHLVVDQLELLDRRVSREQCIPYCMIKGVDRAIALPYHPLALALGRQPYGALGIGLLTMRRLGEDAPGVHREVLRQLRKLSPQ